MDLGEICDAALRYSDNTAGNLLLQRIGGPSGLTAYARRLGDHRTRLDRWETALNSAIPGDARDTTTPSAIAATATALLTGDRLAAGDRWQLRAWMQGNTTSANKFRAALPAGWSLADKTGGGAYAAANDVGLAWGPDGTPLVIALLTHGHRADQTSDEAVFPEVERLVFHQLT